jgi:alanyl-tRNA synthetase
MSRSPLSSGVCDNDSLQLLSCEVSLTVESTKTKFWSANEIRETFLKFFESKGHRRVRSSSLVPHGDPTLLFTNAGMNQFKDVFLGLEKRDYTRATTAQKCVRAGGKHNDLENVGFTKRHHTFFEMMGNFSFGDYFKKDAIAYAWELVTSPDWYGIAKDKLYVTVFGGAEVSPGNKLGVDEEAKAFWLEQNVPAERVVPIPGLKDNFWAMGDAGPCGPCSEIHYDMGPEASEQGHADCHFPCDCGRYVEIWNLVFMQFNRDASGTLTPLPKPCVDTGMGLERVAAVLQGVISNYETDLFTGLLKKAWVATGEPLIEDPLADASLRIIADHSRATAFLITDGVVPSNDGRGYVLRKIMRRAIRHGRLIGATKPFVAEMVNTVREQLGRAYPELLEPAASRVPQIVLAEESRFNSTLTVGLGRLDNLIFQIVTEEFKRNRQAFDEKTARSVDEILTLPGMTEIEAARAVIQFFAKIPRQLILPGAQAFRLYDTYGLPRDFIVDTTRDLGLQFDKVGFEDAMEEQKTKARASWKGAHKEAANPAYARIAETYKTEPGFYYGTHAKDCRIEAIITKSGAVNELKAGESGEVVLDRTAIYAESGGQIYDTGALYNDSETQLLGEVSGAYYPVTGLVAHRVTAKEDLHIGDRVAVVADADRRARVMRNHTGTHLVHAALRNILGTHVKQAGSLNAPDRLRFDFSHFAPVDAEELRDIEQQVNEEIRLNSELETTVTTLDDALASGALAFFGDKYPEHNVRVVTIPDPHAPRGFYSKELCGGTHVKRIGDIGVLKIVSEESVAAGVRRVEGITGIGALEHYQHQASVLASVAKQLNVGEGAILAQVEKLTQTARQLEKQLTDQRRKGALNQLDDLVAKAQTIRGTKVVVSEVENVNREDLRQLVDSLRQKLGSGVVVLGQTEDGKVALIAAVTKDLTPKVHAGKVIQTLAKQVGGKGGGRPDLAEGGGEDTKALNSTLGGVPALLEPLL